MGLRIALLVAAALTAAASSAAQAAIVQFDDAVARVTVIPEMRSDVRVEIVRPTAELPLRIAQSGDRTVISGDLGSRLRDCNGREDSRKVRIRGVGSISWSEMPQVVIRTPRDVRIEADGAVFGSIGRSGSVELQTSGCSGWTVADTTGEAKVRASGAGSVMMGAAERLDVRISGAGNVHATRIRRGMDARLSGAGGVKVVELNGPVQADVSGVGRIQVSDGRATTLKASVSGIGGVDFDGVADSLDASISGLGSIRVEEVRGAVRRSVSGAGRVVVGGT
ncbi:DUF2807 domain-containing protein [Phenylobacterium sp. J426]|uniref:DUF2807 domain-containing protein n=1 Tax=Phenylobacterium sp. J426 TaxID=2898439 RepID=UPI002151906E|nr:DUF2807 domain-containing protein [Phenylobacterium sp. J426]MCR5875340.1 DUF2807 domain-containing protein [Phenylobacterium sp. J426]